MKTCLRNDDNMNSFSNTNRYTSVHYLHANSEHAVNTTLTPLDL